MGKIVVSSNVTLDGVGQDPTGEEGLRFGGWFNRISPADREAWAKTEYEEALGAEALLLGARSYEWFARKWVGRTDAWGERLQTLPKYVVRSGEGRLDWGPTTVLSGDIPGNVARLAGALAGDIVVYGSYQLVRTLLEHELVDEVRLFVFPYVLGSGARLFSDLTAARQLHLADVGTVGTDLVHLTYRTVRAGTEGHLPG
jgi:dihydrofolate reductase